MRRFLLLAAILLGSCVAPPPPATPVSPAPSSARSEEAGNPVTATGTQVRIGERLLPSGMLEIGTTSAPVSLLLFTNHSCAYCREFQEELIPRLTDEYVRSGNLRIAIMPFVLHKYPDSRQASLVLLCATQQGKGITMNDLLFRERINTPTFRTERTAMQLDEAAMTNCMENPGALATIDAQQSVAQSLGVSLVPSYFINGKLYTGLPEYSDLRGQIQEALDGAEL